ncbi:MAG: methylmalonyl-CoA epimerase [Candidatus Geothermarchaeales archaeon]
MAEVMRIDHIGIAVNRLDDALPFYRDALRLELVGVEDVTEEQVRIAMLQIGETRIELLEPLSQDGAVAKFLQERGEGIHHVAFSVDDLASVTKRVKEGGAHLVYSEPRVIPGGRAMNFIHPRSTHGVLVELVERYHEMGEPNGNR